jgi:hypothetical protein
MNGRIFNTSYTAIVILSALTEGSGLAGKGFI